LAPNCNLHKLEYGTKFLLVLRANRSDIKL